jgi:hypothetical protein
MSAGRHEAPRPTDPFMGAVLLALASLLALIVPVVAAPERVICMALATSQRSPA